MRCNLSYIEFIKNKVSHKEAFNYYYWLLNMAINDYYQILINIIQLYNIITRYNNYCYYYYYYYYLVIIDFISIKYCYVLMTYFHLLLGVAYFHLPPPTFFLTPMSSLLVYMLIMCIIIVKPIQNSLVNNVSKIFFLNKLYK